MIKTIERLAAEFIEISKNKKITIISHHDTDGLTSAAILSRALERLDRKFTVRIVKQLEPETIESLPKDNILVFLDLGSSHLPILSKLENIFVIDHHELPDIQIPENIRMINPALHKEKQPLPQD